MTRTRQQSVAKDWRYMKLFMVWHWGTAEEARTGITGGMYVVRAANPEDCVQFLLRTKERPAPAQDTNDVLKRIRHMVARADTVDLNAEFKHEKMVQFCENHFYDTM